MLKYGLVEDFTEPCPVYGLGYGAQPEEEGTEQKQKDDPADRLFVLSQYAEHTTGAFLYFCEHQFVSRAARLRSFSDR